MAFEHLVWQERRAILRAAHLATAHGMIDAWRRCERRGGKPHEPDFVASLVLEGGPLLYDALSAIFQRHKIAFSLAAVYCHQTPKVSFHGMKKKSSCELGDMLLAHVHTTHAGSCARNALLLQAKVSSQQPHKVCSSEKDQLQLYSNWPDFKYTTPPLTGKKRSVVPKSAHAGAQYARIDGRPLGNPRSWLSGTSNTYPVGVCMPDERLYDHDHLAGVMFDCLLGLSGRAFSAQTARPPMDGWSQVVWDLLNVAVKKAFRRKRSGRFCARRYAGARPRDLDGYCFTLATAPVAAGTISGILGPDRAPALFEGSSDSPSSGDFLEVGESDDSHGTSILLFESSERGEG